MFIKESVQYKRRGGRLEQKIILEEERHLKRSNDGVMTALYKGQSEMQQQPDEIGSSCMRERGKQLYERKGEQGCGCRNDGVLGWTEWKRRPRWEHIRLR